MRASSFTLIITAWTPKCVEEETMAEGTHIEMHRDHKQWSNDIALWRDEIALWQEEYQKAIADLSTLETALHMHAKSIHDHEETLERPRKFKKLLDHGRPYRSRRTDTSARRNRQWARNLALRETGNAVANSVARGLLP
jgi:hypothetical protein